MELFIYHKYLHVFSDMYVHLLLLLAYAICDWADKLGFLYVICGWINRERPKWSK